MTCGKDAQEFVEVQGELEECGAEDPETSAIQRAAGNPFLRSVPRRGRMYPGEWLFLVSYPIIEVWSVASSGQDFGTQSVYPALPMCL